MNGAVLSLKNDQREQKLLPPLMSKEHARTESFKVVTMTRIVSLPPAIFLRRKRSESCHENQQQRPEANRSATFTKWTNFSELELNEILHTNSSTVIFPSRFQPPTKKSLHHFAIFFNVINNTTYRKVLFNSLHRGHASELRRSIIRCLLFGLY